MSFLKIMQIGDVFFHLHDQQFFLDVNVKVSTKTEEMLLAPYKVTQNVQWLYKEQSFNVSGLHLNMKNGYNADDILSRLQMWVGKPTFVFGYSLRNMANQGMLGCACEQDCNDGCDMTIMQTYGILESVKQSPDNDNQPAKVTLNITILDFWREIDNYTWDWNGSKSTALWAQSNFGSHVGDELINYVPADCQDFFSKIPSCDEVFDCGNCNGWQYRDWENDKLYYDEYFWYDQYNSECSSKTGGYSEIGIRTLFAWHEIFEDPKRWNVPPLSVYSISGLPNTGIFKIIVERKNGLTFENIVSEIDLDQLQTDFTTNGDGTFSKSDRIIVGDIKRYINDTDYRPCFIEKNDGTVYITKPKWSYEDWFPGMLHPEWSRVAFSYSGSGDVSDFNAAMIHHFRRV